MTLSQGDRSTIEIVTIKQQNDHYSLFLSFSKTSATHLYLPISNEFQIDTRPMNLSSIQSK